MSITQRNDIQELVASANVLLKFVSVPQLGVMAKGLEGEEADYFAELFKTYAERITNMATTYQQDGKGDDAIVYLHYFKGGMDWYITEKDVTPDEPQHQAFGLADLGDGDGELGYISIAELIDCGVELDLHFEPTTMRQVRQNKAICVNKSLQ